MPKGKTRPSKRPQRGRSAAARLQAVTIGDVGELLTEGAGYLRRMLNVEVKRFDASSALATPTTAGVVIPLSIVPLGDDFYQRDGHSIKAVGLEARLYGQTNAAADLLRMVVFADLECQGALPTIAQLLEPGPFAAPFQHDNLKRFVVLHDELIALHQPYAVATEPFARTLKLSIDHHLKFQSAVGTIADCREGALFCAFVANTATTQAAVYSRLSFVDN
jgi:hypothetical protein